MRKGTVDVSDLHGAIWDLLGDGSGWSLIWRRTGYDRVVSEMTRLVVLDPDGADDWLQAVDDAVRHVRRMQRRHLTLVTDDEGET